MSIKDELIGAKGGSDSSFRNTPDNLRSTDTFEALIGLTSGRIKGLAPGGLQNLFVDDVPIEDGQGHANLTNFVATMFDGDPAVLQPIQLQLGGSSGATSINLSVNNPNQNGIPGDWRNGSVSQIGVDFIDLRFVVSQLYRQDKKGIYDTTARLEVELQPSGSSTWINPLTDTSAPQYNPNGFSSFGGLYTIFASSDFWEDDGSTWYDPNPGYLTINGKTTSPFIKELRIAVPNTGAWANRSWNIRVRLVDRDSYTQDQNEERRTISWESAAGVSSAPIGGREEWRGLAYLHVNGKATDQLTGIPTITSICDLSLCRVPPSSVWNAETQSYTGATWDGATEEIQWTRCPAFQMKDLIEDGVSGISALVPGSTLNKWDTLDASKWFAERVPDGQGGTQPRYTMNYLLDQSLSVNDLMQYVAGAVGSYAYDQGDGQWRLIVDKPENAATIFTKENIVGEFTYSHTDIDTRFNDMTGVFRDESRRFEETRVRVFDQGHIDTYGRNHQSIALVGATNRQEALRRLKLRQLVSLNETRIVNFTTNRQGRLLTPFSVVLVADQDLGVTGVRTTGRLIQTNGTSLTVRDSVRLELGINYKIHITVPNPDYEAATVTQPTSSDWKKPTITITRNITNNASQRGDVTNLYIDDELPDNTPENANIAFEAVGLPTMPKQYRILSVEPDENGELVQLTAVEIYTSKWDESDNVDEGEILAQQPTKTTPPPETPDNGMFTVTIFDGDFGVTRRVMTVAWLRPGSMWVDGFKVEYQLNGGSWQTITEKTQDTYVELTNPTNGDYRFRITTLDRRGGVSSPLLGDFTLTDMAGSYAPTNTQGPLIDRPSEGARVGDRYTTTDQNPNITYVWTVDDQWVVETNFVDTADQITYLPPTGGGPTPTVQDLKPDGPGATRGAPSGTNVAGRPAETLVSQVDTSIQDISNILVNVDDLQDMYGDVVSAAASANAANTYKQAAEAARDQAASAQAASEGAKDVAVTKATEAAQSATSASGFATTASGQATIATQQADAASQSANTASAKTDIATTKAGEASVSAQSAATSKNDALGYANAAASSAGVAASLASDASAAGSNSPALAPSQWTTEWNSFRPGSSSSLTAQLGPNIQIIGGVVRVSSSAQLTIGPYAPIPIVAGHRYRYRTNIRAVVTGDIYEGLISCFDTNGNFIGYSYHSSGPVTTSSGGFNFTISTDALADAQFLNLYSQADRDRIAFARPCVIARATGTGGTAVDDIISCSLIDVDSEVNAELSASAAAQSAQSAAASRDQAGQYASSALSSSTTASTKAADANTYAGQASTSATSASSSASQAASSAGVAANASTNARNAAAVSWPSDFSQGGLFFTALQGDPATALNIDQYEGNVTFVTDSSGKLMRTTNPYNYQQTRLRSLISTGNVGRRYRLEAQVRVVSMGDQSLIRFTPATYGLGSDFVTVYYSGFISGFDGSQAFIADVTSGTDWHTIYSEFEVLNGAPCPWISAGLYVYFTGGQFSNGTIIDYKYISLKDITAQTQADSSAAAAATSASSASASAGLAGSNATSASQSANNASVSAGNASNSASSASSSAASASSSASAALSNVTLSASIAAQSFFTNMNFTVWSTTAEADGWSQWTNPHYTQAPGIAPNPYSVMMDTLGYATGGCGAYQATPAGSTPGGVNYIVTVDLQLIGGSISGAGIAVRGLGGATVTENLDFLITGHIDSYTGAIVTDSQPVGSRIKVDIPFTYADYSTDRTLLYIISDGYFNNNPKKIQVNSVSMRRASQIDSLASQVQTIAGALADIMGNQSAYWQTTVNAGTGLAFITAKADSQARVAAPLTANYGFGTGSFPLTSPLMSINGRNISRTSGPNAWNQGAFISNEKYSTTAGVGPYLSFNPINTTQDIIVGLTSTPQAAVYTSYVYDYSWNLTSNGMCNVLVGTSNVVNAGAYTATDTFSIEQSSANGGSIIFKRNNVVIHTVTGTGVRTYYLAVNVYVANTGVNNVVFTPTPPVSSSNVSIGAGEFQLFNPASGGWKLAMQVSGGNVIFTGGLQAGAFIRQGNGRGWPVALAQQDFNVGDDMYLDYGTNLANVPDFTFQRNNLAPLAAGETYQLYIENPTTTGGTLRAKIITPDTPYSVTLTTESAPGTGPTRQMEKYSNPDSNDGTYTMAFSGSAYGYLTNPGGVDENGGYYEFNQGMTIGIWVRRSGAWQKITQVYAYAYNYFYETGHRSTSTESWAYYGTVQLGTGIEAFGITMDYTTGISADILSMDGISWTALNMGTGVRTALPNGSTTIITVRPR